MKRSLLVVMTVLTWLCITLCVSASASSITTYVPEWLLVHIESEGGNITINGKPYSDGSTLLIPYNTDFALEILPAQGRYIKQAHLDGEDITSQIDNNRYTMPGLMSDTTLHITQLAAISDAADKKNTVRTVTRNPATGQTESTLLYLLIAGVSFLTAGYCIIQCKNKKQGTAQRLLFK